MTENTEGDWRERWNAFTGSGHFDEIKHPEGGYEIGDPVTDRSGIFSLVKGFKGTGEVILALDRDPDGKEKVVDKDDIRPNGDVGGALIREGYVKIPEDKRVEIDPPSDFPGKNAKQN